MIQIILVTKKNQIINKILVMKNSIMIIKICDKKADYKETNGDVDV